MDPSPTQQPQPERRDHDSGRVAVPEIAELLHLQRPAAAVAAAAVVLFALLVTLVAPGVLPANVVSGLVVGVLALLAAAATAVVLDGRDPVLRGPRHLRRDGHAVLARMAGPDPVQHGGPVLAALERRLEGREHLGVVLTGTGADPSRLAVTLGRAAAAAGHTALVIDLRAPGAPGVADVGEGTVRLGEAAQLADDRPYAWIGAGVDREAAAGATAGVARRPPRDLKLLLVVAPDAATHVPEVLQACDRTVLLVAADTQQRAMVTARLNALERAGGRPEAVVIGGLRVVPDDTAALDNGSTTAAASQDTASPDTASPGTASSAAPAAEVVPEVVLEPTVTEEEPEPTVAAEPEPLAPEPLAPEPVAPEPFAPEPFAPEPVQQEATEQTEQTEHDEYEHGEHDEHEHDGHQPPTPTLLDDEPTAFADAGREVPPTAAEEEPAADAADQAEADQARSQHHGDPLVDTGPLPPVFRTAAPARREAAPTAPARTETVPTETVPTEAAPADPAPTQAAPADPPASVPPASEAAAAPETASADRDRAVTAPVGDTEVEGMAETDELLTLAALDQLVSERQQRDTG